MRDTKDQVVHDSGRRSPDSKLGVWGFRTGMALVAMQILLLALLSWSFYPELRHLLFRPSGPASATRYLLDRVNWACECYLRNTADVSHDFSIDGYGVNAGAKALWASLCPEYLIVEGLEERGNAARDDDGVPMIVDGWGNPLVFIPKSAYGQRFAYRNRAGQRFEVVPRQQELQMPFHLWSLGPDGLSDGGDDVSVPIGGQSEK